LLKHNEAVEVFKENYLQPVATKSWWILKYISRNMLSQGQASPHFSLPLIASTAAVLDFLSF
jgi:hypothetical protein